MAEQLRFPGSARSGQASTPNPGRFTALWTRRVTREGAQAEAVYKALTAFYGEAHRHYHTLRHIEHCLIEFDQAAALMDDADAVEMALWFHDVIYQPKAADNERRSAEWYRQAAAGSGSAVFQQKVCDLILATTHRRPPTQDDARFIVDIDLSSFGLPWERCERDGRRIRAEFAGLDDARYYPNHLRFLRSLRRRPTLFRTEFFQRRYESIARANLDRIIAELRARGYR